MFFLSDFLWFFWMLRCYFFLESLLQVILVSQEMTPKLFKLLEILYNFNSSKLTLSYRSKIFIRSLESSDKEIHACETNPKRNTNKIHREYGSGSCYSYKAMSNPFAACSPSV
ncbi:hypothetical protein GLYMA_09G138750v4 [Glycine max]|nr:hypothetical protein GLYMA_09G138750v4 [Glycine max]KAH1042929.1 hypothetical protein GYH30_024998 [Glycine max]